MKRMLNLIFKNICMLAVLVLSNSTTLQATGLKISPPKIYHEYHGIHQRYFDNYDINQLDKECEKSQYNNESSQEKYACEALFLKKGFATKGESFEEARNSYYASDIYRMKSLENLERRSRQAETDIELIKAAFALVTGKQMIVKDDSYIEMQEGGTVGGNNVVFYKFVGHYGFLNRKSVHISASLFPSSYIHFLVVDSVLVMKNGLRVETNVKF